MELKAAQAMGQDNDILYNRVIVNMQRLLKMLTGHSSSIDSLERKLREMQLPKKKSNSIVEAIDTRKIMRKSHEDSKQFKKQEQDVH